MQGSKERTTCCTASGMVSPSATGAPTSACSRAPAVQAAAAVGGFLAFLAEVGAERDTEQQAKTRWALDYYAAKLLPKPEPAAARKAAKPKRKAGGAPRRRKGATPRRPALKKVTRAAAKQPSRRG